MNYPEGIMEYSDVNGSVRENLPTRRAARYTYFVKQVRYAFYS